MAYTQLSLELNDHLKVPDSPEVLAAVEMLSSASGESRGDVFTRPEVVNFVLDLVGYTKDRPLYELRALEPSFGAGGFLLPMIERLLAAWQASERTDCAEDELARAIRAVELHKATYEATWIKVWQLLKQHGFANETAHNLINSWLTQGDFLLASFDDQFDIVVGNPPYVRPELIPIPLLNEYRRRYRAMYDRADLYVAFIERGLSLLTPAGVLGFICSDRWMKNRYGGPLRNLVAEQFHLRIYVDMVDTPAFQSKVVAYPAITIIGRESAGITRVVHRPTLDEETLAHLADELRSSTLAPVTYVRELVGVTNGPEPWLMNSPDHLSLIRRVEAQYPQMEAAGCTVGIGVATGADRVFVDRYDALDIETERKIPLVTTKDVATGEVLWGGLAVINPFAEDGSLVELDRYPRLKGYLEARRSLLEHRHCVRRSPAQWYRTIDRITPGLTGMNKLLIPDIKGQAHVVFEEGRLYPHHNLYYVTSEEWDLRALQAVLLSNVTRLFITAYTTRMRGDFLRFQAQYLRRLRIPRWADVPTGLRLQAIKAAQERDLHACNHVAFQLYNLTADERAALADGRE